MLAYKILLILFAANGAPIILRNLLGERFAHPVDCGLEWLDGTPLLGPSKSWLGIVGGLLAGAATAWAVGLEAQTGLAAGALSMLGDVFSSFIKRRIKIPPSGMALGLDQIPEALFPLLGLKGEWHLGFGEVLWLVFTFLVLELAVSQVLFRLHIRKQPY